MSNAAALLDQAQRSTQRVCDDVRNAQLTWAHFEAVNGDTDPERAQLRDGVSRLSLGHTMHALQLALVRDTLMALFRATDDPGDDRLTLCRVSLALENDDVREDRKAAARNWISSSYPELREKDAATCESSMQAIRDAVPPKWKRAGSLTDLRLLKLRETLMDVRDGSLAHALEGDSNVVINDIRSFLAVASELAARAELIFLGAAPNWETERRRRFKEANEFWGYCQKGF